MVGAFISGQYVFNIVLSLGFIAFFAFIVIKLVRYAKQNGEEPVEYLEYENLSELNNAVFEDINRKVSSDSSMLKLRVGAKDAETMEQARRLQAEAVHDCTSGNEGARDLTKQLVRNFVAPYIGQGERAVKRMKKLIDFDNPSGRVMFEAICYVLGPDDDEGFCRAFNMMHPTGRVITEKDLLPIYRQKCSNLTDIQKQEILTQISYADTFGLGTIDTANFQKGIIDEIQLGAGGLSPQSFSRVELINRKLKHYSCDDVRFMIRGNTYKIPFLGFGTNEEIGRVCSNLIICTDGGELTQKSPFKQLDAVDGRRINVFGNPAASTYVALIRKYDSFHFEDIRDSYSELPDGKFLAQLLVSIVTTGRNIAISGLMAAGKTYLLRMLVALLKVGTAVRSVEKGARELMLRRFLSSEYSVIDFKICEGFDEEACFSAIKQSSGEVGVLGEVNSDSGWQLLLQMTTFFNQTFWTTFETSTDRMIEAAKRALLALGYAGDPNAAEREAAKSIQFDVKVIRRRNGFRFIKAIYEIVPIDDEVLDLSMEGRPDLEKIYMAILSIAKQMRRKSYKVVPIIEYNKKTKKYDMLNDISEESKKSFEDQTGLDWPGIGYIRENGIDDYLSAVDSEDEDCSEDDATDLRMDTN